MKFETIYCDLDGVFCNFHLGALRAHLAAGRRLLDHHGTPLELTHTTMMKRWPRGVSCHQVCVPNTPNVKDYWEEAMGPFWAPIRIDPIFWQKLEPFPWNRQLLRLLMEYTDDLRFVTTPDDDERAVPHSYTGKRQWMQNNGLAKHRPILCYEKWRLARPRCLLIDDYEGHIINWRDQVDHWFREPGHAILFPQPWNEGHPHSADPVGYVRQQIEEILNG